MIPQMAAIPTPGNQLSDFALALSANYCVPLDVSAEFEDQVTVVHTTGAAAAGTSGLQVQPYYVIGTTTTTGTLTSGTSTVLVGSTAGIGYNGNTFGQQALLVVDNEILKVSSVNTGTLTITFTANALRTHASGSNVYIIAQTPELTLTPGQNLTAANTTYGTQSIRLATGQYVLVMTNLDATNAITVSVTDRAITGVA